MSSLIFDSKTGKIREEQESDIYANLTKSEKIKNLHKSGHYNKSKSKRLRNFRKVRLSPEYKNASQKPLFALSIDGKMLMRFHSIKQCADFFKVSRRVLLGYVDTTDKLCGWVISKTAPKIQSS